MNRLEHHLKSSWGKVPSLRKSSSFTILRRNHIVATSHKCQGLLPAVKIFHNLALCRPRSTTIANNATKEEHGKKGDEEILFYEKAPSLKTAQRRMLDYILIDGSRKKKNEPQATGGRQILNPAEMEAYRSKKKGRVFGRILLGTVAFMVTLHVTRLKTTGSVPAQAQKKKHMEESNANYVVSATEMSQPYFESAIQAQSALVDVKLNTNLDTQPSENSEIHDQRTYLNSVNMKGTKKIINSRESEAKPKPIIIEDADDNFDELAVIYKKNMEEVAHLNELVAKAEEEHQEKSRMEKVLNLIFMKSSDPGDANIRRREAKRLARRLQPTVPPPRTATRISLGAAQVLQEKTKSDRFDLGIIKAHKTKFFYVGLMDGYNGWQMAEYVRQNFKNRLEKSLENSPLFLIRDSIVGAVIELEEDLKKMMKGASTLKMTEGISMGCCLLMALIDTSSIIIGNVGTSKSVISRDGVAYRLNMWHSASTLHEQRLLVKASGREENALKCARQQDVPRKVEGPLAVPFWLTDSQGFDTMYLECLVKGMSSATRALGHYQLKDPELGKLFPEMTGSNHYPYVSSLPSVNVYPRTKHDDFLILGTNGFWEAVEEREAVAVVHETIQNLYDAIGGLNARDYAQVAADRLMSVAIQNHRALHSRDLVGERQDMTVIVIPLNVETVAGLPELNPKILECRNRSSWTWLKHQMLGSSEEVFKKADWNTKLRWHHDKRSNENNN